MGAFALWRTGHAATGKMVAMVHGVSCPLAPPRGHSADWLLCLLSWCAELSAPPPLHVLYGVTNVQQRWGGGDADHASSWAGKCGDEATVGPLIAWA